MRMPELDGYQTTQRLKADPALRHIPVIAVTASSFREEEARARKVCDGFIRKPLNRSELIGELRRFLKPAVRPAAAEDLAPDVSTARRGLPPQSLARWPELLARLRQEQEQVWPELCQTLEITPVEEFGQRLRDWGDEYGADLLRRYGQALFEQAARLDLERLPKTLEQFPELIDQLQRQSTCSQT
jgi:CheY-like chemotaxis protein